MTGEDPKEAGKNIGKNLLSKCSTPKLYSKRQRKIKPPMSKEKLVEFLTNSKRNDFKKRRKRQSTKNRVDIDEASRLQTRSRNIFTKLRREQNLLDAYSTEGWKGQSREKIKPEKELQRAKKQILKCKLGLRDALRQLDLLSTEGRIDESVIAPDGSIHHDHIHCAKCKLREAFPDNDIILCDGTCNCAFHQMCIDPPLLTENIPPGDQGWYCKYCICKTDIIDAMNAQLGTSYTNDTNWEEVFKVEATLPEGGGDTLLDQEDWPSDEPDDVDYDPEKVEKHQSSCNNQEGGSSPSSSSDDDGNSNNSFISLDDEILDDESQELRNKGIEVISADLVGPGSGSGSGSDFELVSGRRQRRAVDYRQLYDEMFGKDALVNEQVSEDEDWGPTNRKRREKESDAATTLMTLCETEDKTVKDVGETEINKIDTEAKRSSFRISSEAVEKLRAVFAKNELPSQAVKKELSKQLGLDPDKVNKWFKNARYLSLKRKAGEDDPTQNDGPKESGTEIENINEILSENNVALIPCNEHTKRFRRMNNPQPPSGDPKKQLQECGDLHVSTSTNNQVDTESASDNQQEAAEAQMQKLCFLKTKVENLQKMLLLRTPNRRAKTTALSSIDHSSTILVPIAHLKEKP